MSEQFEVSTWADAEVTAGPGNPAHPDHAAWLAEQSADGGLDGVPASEVGGGEVDQGGVIGEQPDGDVAVPAE